MHALVGGIALVCDPPFVQDLSSSGLVAQNQV